MPKRANTEATDAQDAPGAIAHRRKARISSKFRPSGQAAPTAPASSAFAGMATAKPGFVFGVGAAVQPPTNSFSIGSGSAPKVAAAPGGFSFLNNAPAASPAAGSKALASAQPAALDPQRVSPSTPQGAPSSTAVAPGRQGGAFGEGRTAARGGRLNERFTSWLSHQLSEDAASFLDSGLRDYVTFAAEIRERADFSRPEPVPTTAFDHPSETIASTSTSQAMPKPSETGTSPAASIPEPPPAAAAPAPAPSPVVKPAPTFTFSAPSSLPAAPPGPQFSFTLPSAATTSATSEEPTAVASSPPSSLGGFKFNAGGFGAAGVSHGAFNGFKVPAGVPIPPPVAADSSGAIAEEDGMPKEDPSKLERAPGEENEEILGQFRAKLFRFKKDEKSWGDMGVGQLRLMKHTTNDGRRMVLRNDMGKVILNAAVYEGMGVTKKKNMIEFIANVAGDGPTLFMVKVTKEEIDNLHTRVMKLVPSS